jgi:hypothetical protein
MGPQVRGFGFVHDGSIDTVFRFLHFNVFLFENDVDRRDSEALVMAFDTTLAPIAGQQITLDDANDVTVGPRIDLLLARAREPFVWPGGANARECEVVVHGVVDSEPRGYLYDGAATFTPDRAADAALTEAALRALASTPGQPLTFTCAPPGSGRRMAIDRDEDGVLDGDELTAGTPSASRPLATIPALVLPTPPTGGDAGPDAGDPRGGGGCDCIVPGPKGTGEAPWLGGGFLVALATIARARRSRSRVRVKS